MLFNILNAYALYFPHFTDKKATIERFSGVPKIKVVI